MNPYNQAKYRPGQVQLNFWTDVEKRYKAKLIALELSQRRKTKITLQELLQEAFDQILDQYNPLIRAILDENRRKA